MTCYELSEEQLTQAVDQSISLLTYCLVETKEHLIWKSSDGLLTYNAFPLTTVPLDILSNMSSEREVSDNIAGWVIIQDSGILQYGRSHLEVYRLTMDNKLIISSHDLGPTFQRSPGETPLEGFVRLINEEADLQIQLGLSIPEDEDVARLYNAQFDLLTDVQKRQLDRENLARQFGQIVGNTIAS